MTHVLWQVPRFVLVLLSIVISQAVLTAGEWDFGGDLRARWEDKTDFNFDASNQDYVLSRVRLHTSWTSDGGTSVFVELQDARIFDEERTGVPPINENGVPNIYKDEADLHQAYLTVPLGESGKLKLGRQKFNLGDKRLVSSLEWVNTARVHDGLRLTYGNPKERTLDVFATRLVPVNPQDPNDWARTGSRYMNSEFHGLWYSDKITVPDGHFNVYLLYRNLDHPKDRVYTLGGSITKRAGQVEVTGEAAVQAGDFGGVDHEAFFLHMDAWYNADWNKTRFGLTYNYGSGDDNTRDGKHQTFDNLYPFNHAFYGYMDLFSVPNLSNLELVFQTQLFERGVLRLGLHRFNLNEPETDNWYNAGLGVQFPNAGAPRDDHAGDEIDLTVNIPIIPKTLTALAGYSRFFPGDYLEIPFGNRTEPKFAFVQALLTF